MRNKDELVELIKKYPYPRRRFIRTLLRSGIALGGSLLTHFEISGRDNLPKEGPFIIVGNHFHFLDTIGPIHSTSYPLEFIGDFEMPNAPKLMRMFPNAWRTLKVEQGTPNFETIKAAEAVLSQKGVLVIFPEGHTHEPPLGQALPGAAYLAMRSGVPLLPIATYSDNGWDLFGTIKRKKHRIRVWANIGKPFGPLPGAGLDRPSREQIKESSRIIMSHIAALLPPAFRGEYDTGATTAG